MAYGMPCDKPDNFGKSDPPKEIWDAEERLKCTDSKAGDRETVQAFKKYHYWDSGMQGVRQ